MYIYVKIMLTHKLMDLHSSRANSYHEPPLISANVHTPHRQRDCNGGNHLLGALKGQYFGLGTEEVASLLRLWTELWFFWKHYVQGRRAKEATSTPGLHPELWEMRTEADMPPTQVCTEPYQSISTQAQPPLHTVFETENTAKDAVPHTSVARRKHICPTLRLPSLLVSDIKPFQGSQIQITTWGDCWKSWPVVSG